MGTDHGYNRRGKIRYEALLQKGGNIMCRFILLDSYKEKGKRYLVIYDKVKGFCDIEPLWRYRMRIAFYEKHGIKRREP